jgi:UV DNA damage endonuclease
MQQNVGYCCINTELRKQDIYSGRTCRKATWQEKGLEYVGELGLQNLRDLFKMLQWNERQDIKLFRIGSDIFPWSSEYEYKDLPQYDKACMLLRAIGDFAVKHGHRLSFHPGPFNILGSTKPEVVERTIVDLDHHSQLFDLMGFAPSPYNKINIHIGASYGEKQATLDRWMDNFRRLHPNTQKRLTLENDDRSTLYTIADLMQVHEKCNIPLVFDYHHHNCHPGDLNVEQALALAISTWPEGITPVVHYSSSRRLNEDNSVKVTAHADYLYETINTYGHKLDIQLEAKAKEQALLKYRNKTNMLT